MEILSYIKKPSQWRQRFIHSKFHIKVINACSGPYVALLQTLLLFFLGATVGKCIEGISNDLDFLNGIVCGKGSSYCGVKGVIANSGVWFPEFVLGAHVTTLIFLPVFVAFICVFCARELAISERVIQKEGSLFDAIRTMPPPNLMDIFSVVIRNSRAYREDLLRLKASANTTPKVLLSASSTPSNKVGEERTYKGAIRLALQGLCGLAKQFQYGSDGTRYAANIMLYRDFSEITDPAEFDKIFEKIKRFTDVNSVECMRSEIQGVLELILDLTASSDDTSSGVDDRLTDPIVLPIPKVHLSDKNGKFRVIPGAPRAFIGNPQMLFDTHRILEEYDLGKAHEITRGVFENLSNYFNDEQGRDSRSIFSIAISDRASGNRLGVINIHSDAKRLFVNDEILEQYKSLIWPIIYEIFDLTAEALSA